MKNINALVMESVSSHIMSNKGKYALGSAAAAGVGAGEVAPRMRARGHEEKAAEASRKWHIFDARDHLNKAADERKSTISHNVRKLFDKHADRKQDLSVKHNADHFNLKHLLKMNDDKISTAKKVLKGAATNNEG